MSGASSAYLGPAQRRIGAGLFFVIAGACLMFAHAAYAAARKVNVGIYQNPPKVYLRPDGVPAGFIVDIMKELALQEGWELCYNFDTWEANLRRLRQGELDLMLDVSYTPERSHEFEFNSVPVIESWLQVFAMKGRRIESVKDLNGLRLAVLRHSHQHAFLSTTLKKYHTIDYVLADYDDYQGTVDALRSGRVDAIVAGRFFFFSHQRGSDIVPTPVIIDPTNILFAFPRGGDPGLISAIDRRLSTMKNDPDSAYYHILQKSLALNMLPVVPRYVFIVIGIVAGIGVFMASAAWILRRQVAARTLELRLRNYDLHLAQTQLNTALDEAEKAGVSLGHALEQRDALLRELFHRTGNNMQVISSLLNLQAEDSRDPAFQRCIHDAVNRIRAISMVHERLDRDRDLSRIDLAEYLQSLAMSVRASFGFTDAEAAFDFSLEPLSIVFDYAIPCGLILNELLMNAFKNGFAGKKPGGVISLRLALDEDSTVRIVYRDNGTGYGAACADSGSNALGMRIIRSIAGLQLKGTVECDTGGGCSCALSFIMSGYRERV